MSFKYNVIKRATKFTEKDLDNFNQDLERFKSNILKIKELEGNLSNERYIQLFYKSLFNVIKDSQEVDQIDFFRFLSLENLLKSKESDAILSKAIKDKIYTDNMSIEFCGNKEKDIKGILKEYYDVYYKYKLKRLKEENLKNPSNSQIKRELDSMQNEIAKLENGELTLYEENKFKQKQKAVLESLYKKYKSIMVDGLSKGILSKVRLLNDMGCLDVYAKQYNNMLEKVSISSILKVRNGEDIFKTIANEKYLTSLPVSDLLALNAFWTNRLTKEVEKINKIVYLLRKTDSLDKFLNGEEVEFGELKIRSTLAEYTVLANILTEYKLKRKESMENVNTLSDNRFASIKVNLRDLFSDNEIREFGEKKLNYAVRNIISLNNFSQLLYDQKDMMIENVVSYLLNGSNYANAGLIPSKSNSKALIGIDLKGYNAPIVLHYHRKKLKDVVKKFTGKNVMPMYRGAKDFVSESYIGNSSNEWISTNILFPITKEQKLKLAQRAAVSSPQDYNAKYIKHILWMYNPKKDMPADIAEPFRKIDLGTGEITELNNIYKEKVK